MKLDGWLGVGFGIGIFLVTWTVVWLRTDDSEFSFEPTEGFFERLIGIYLDTTKFIVGLAAGGIVLVVGSSAVGTTKRLPESYASPLFLLAMSIFYGIIFMPLLVLNYEAFRHGTTAYTRPKYVRNRTLGYSALACFCVGYGWLIWAATRG